MMPIAVECRECKTRREFETVAEALGAGWNKLTDAKGAETWVCHADRLAIPRICQTDQIEVRETRIQEAAAAW